jgi:hypothetical protein
MLIREGRNVKAKERIRRKRRKYLDKERPGYETLVLRS